MSHRLKTIVFVLVTAALLTGIRWAVAKRFMKSDRPIRVLITDGHSNHDWKRTTALLKGILQQAGLFTVDVSTAPADEKNAGYSAWCPEFSNYDVVIQNYNDMGGGSLWPEPARKAFERFVANGGGVFILHSANNAFPMWEEYNRIIGMGWRSRTYGYALKLSGGGGVIRIPPGEGANTSHGKRTDRLLHLLANDPVHQGMPKEWMTPLIEVYTHARGPAENVTVLSWAEDPINHEFWPIEWTVRYGKGRVYNSTFGHVWKDEGDPVDLRCVGFQTVLIRSLQWLAGRHVSWPIPPDFPTADRISLRPLSGDPGPTRP
jgi:type 1 glutamine amidotransferase